VTEQNIESHSARAALENEFKRRFPEQGKMPIINGVMLDFLHDMLMEIAETRDIKENLKKLERELEQMKLQMITISASQGGQKK
jgi:hypothetical protein